MLFQKKKYLSVPLASMKVYGENKQDILVDGDENNRKLSDGTDIILFFEYKPKSLRDYGVVRESISRVPYTRYFGFNQNWLYSEKTGTIYDGDDLRLGYCLEYPTKEEVLDYMKSLRNKGLYEEYAQKVSSFYTGAQKIRSETKGTHK